MNSQNAPYPVPPYVPSLPAFPPLRPRRGWMGCTTVKRCASCLKASAISMAAGARGWEALGHFLRHPSDVLVSQILLSVLDCAADWLGYFRLESQAEYLAPRAQERQGRGPCVGALSPPREHLCPSASSSRPAPGPRS